jgi:hypothetical protein
MNCFDDKYPSVSLADISPEGELILLYLVEFHLYAEYQTPFKGVGGKLLFYLLSRENGLILSFKLTFAYS